MSGRMREEVLLSVCSVSAFVGKQSHMSHRLAFDTTLSGVTCLCVL